MNRAAGISLALENLSVRYPRSAENAVTDVSLRVSGGEFVALAGPNGCGKTTLLRAASGVLAPLEGRATAGDVTRSIHLLSPAQRARLLAVVPQMAGLPAGYSVREAVMLGRISFHGWFGPETDRDRESVQSALRAVGLASTADRPVDTLSGGMQQRVLIARALAQEAPILLMDEPTAHLDIRFQIETLSLLHRFVRGKGFAIVAAMHDLNLAARFADRIVLLSRGRLVRSGVPADVLTEEILSALYDHPMRVIPHPHYGYPLVLPDGRGPFPVPEMKRE
jgi:iron complex transport system ATP-binding protein